MKKILAIVPYEGLKNLFHEVIVKHKIKNIDVYIGELKEGVKTAKNMKKGYEVVISRGATAKFIREAIDLPVIEVNISGYDILRTLQLIDGLNEKIGIMSYLNVISGVESIGKLLNKRFSLYPIHDENEIKEKLNEAHRDGIEVIIGDSFSATYAEKFGFRSILISSGEEAVLDSIHEANLMANYLFREKENSKYYTTVLDQKKDGLIIIDSEYKCQFINKSAQELLGIDKGHVGEDLSNLGTEFAELKRQIDFRSNFDLFHVQNRDYYIKIDALHDNRKQMGTKITFIEKKDISIDKVSHYVKNDNTNMYFNHFVQNSKVMIKIIQLAGGLSKSDEPIYIYGEEGTGKSELAKIIHNGGLRKTKPYYYINCKAYSIGKLHNLLFGIGGEREYAGIFEKALGGTVYLDNVDFLPFTLQLKVKRMLETKKVVRKYETQERFINPRIISGSKQKIEHGISEGELDAAFFEFLNQYTIHIPPLRERREDIDDFIRWFIADFNRNSGKQIVGLSKNVSDFVHEYHWPGNVIQLKYIIGEMCELSKGPFIEKDEVQSILLNLQRPMEDTKSSKIEVSNKSLRQIEHDVIEKVLQLEDYNQSNAARKLQIGRSTLWRKLNSAHYNHNDKS